MLVIESNLIIYSTSSWVLDSGSSAHICTSMQGLIESKRLRENDMILRVDNGVKVTAKAVGTYSLRLPSDFRLDLKDYYFVPIASRNLISVSVLARKILKLVSIKAFVLFIYEINWLHEVF